MAGKLRHEAPSQRRRYRITAPIEFEAAGGRYHAHDWSVLDFRLRDYDGPLKPGDHAEFKIHIPYQGFIVTFPANARIVRADAAEKSLIGEFFNLGEREKEILEVFVSGLVRGEMESVDGMLRRMDLPVTPASLKPDQPLTAKEVEKQEKKRRLGSLMYILAGLIFSGVLAVVIYTNFFQIKVHTAIIASPTDIIISPATGNVSLYHTGLREIVASGDNLVEFVDPELETSIERASLRLEEALLSARQGADKEEKQAESGEVQASQASVQALQNSLAIHQATINRIRDLVSRGLARATDLEEARGKFFAAQSELNQARERLNKLRERSTQQLSLLSLIEGEYRLLKDQRRRLMVSAPAKGRIINMLVQEGASVRYGDPVALFQHEEPKYVEAYLLREEALHVAIGDIAKVHFPSHNINADFQVQDIDYASQLITRREGRYTLEQAGLSRDVLVKLTPVNTNAGMVKNLVPGTQAVVVFSVLKKTKNLSVTKPSAADEVKTPSPQAVSAGEVYGPFQPADTGINTLR